MGTSAYIPAEFTRAEAQAELAADAERLAERCRHLEEMFVVSDQALADQAQIIRDQKAERDQLRGQLERTEAARAQLADDLTAMQARTSRRIAALAQGNAAMKNELAGARVIIEARDNRVAQLDLELDRQIEEAAELRAALHRAQDRAQTASDAAESYRLERNAARATIDKVARLIDPES